MCWAVYRTTAHMTRLFQAGLKVHGNLAYTTLIPTLMHDAAYLRNHVLILATPETGLPNSIIQKSRDSGTVSAQDKNFSKKKRTVVAGPGAPDKIKKVTEKNKKKKPKDKSNKSAVHGENSVQSTQTLARAVKGPTVPRESSGNAEDSASRVGKCGGRMKMKGRAKKNNAAENKHFKGKKALVYHFLEISEVKEDEMVGLSAHVSSIVYLRLYWRTRQQPESCPMRNFAFSSREENDIQQGGTTVESGFSQVREESELHYVFAARPWFATRLTASELILLDDCEQKLSSLMSRTLCRHNALDFSPITPQKTVPKKWLMISASFESMILEYGPCISQAAKLNSFVAHTFTSKFDFMEYLVTIFGHYISRTTIAELRKAL
ncbi:hypothetical protein SISNIDRAFT_465795 [Sistotremastrum niveocremeum HHB9708]|uniref:Uncharacterized protein n=1 Tax=Sistotremastrum niveocremeum HHB9708 TaxID=1314777 RepID=A0A164UX16_9AGAM|nr:hypothetical protein SISNIDRAFT_465795 [Sistotremastrum niveocremeum HHB9708]